MMTAAPTKTIKPTKANKKPEGAQAETVFGEHDDNTFNPAEMIAQFTKENAGHVITYLLGHAANNPKAACWVAACLFGEGGWSADAAAFVGSTDDPEAYARARSRAVDSYVSGRIDAPALGLILKVLDECQMPMLRADAHSACR